MRFPFVTSVCVLGCLLGGTHTPVAAQDVSPLLIGERVRARALEGATHDGPGRTFDAIELGLQIGQDGDDLLVLPLTSLEKAGIGALVGGGLGTVAAIGFIYADCQTTSTAGGGCGNAGGQVAFVALAAVVVATPFALIGALVGTPFKTDRWEDGPLSPRQDVQLRPSGRLEWSVSFPVGR